MPDPFGSPDRLRSIEEALRRYRPDLYPQKSAYPQGFDLDHAIDTDDVGAIANQFASGLLSGFSGLGNYADEPRTQWEAIANSFGSVLGFMGILIPGTSIFKGVGLGLKGLSLVAGATRVAGAARVAEGIYGLGRGIEKARSIPLLIGEVGWKAIERRKAGQVAMDFLAKKNPLYAQMVEDGTRLAIASAFPSLIQEGVGSALESAAYGFATAGLMGVGVGNLPFLKEAHVPATFLRAMAGAITQTGMVAGISGMNPLDMPTEELVYESLLGAYFGSKAVSAKTYQASREWNRIFEKNGRQPLAMRYSQDQIKAYNTLDDWQDVQRRDPELASEMGRISEHMLGKKSVIGNIMSRMLRAIAPDYWTKGGAGYFFPVRSVAKVLSVGEEVRVDMEEANRHYRVKELLPDNQVLLENLDGTLSKTVHKTDIVQLEVPDIQLEHNKSMMDIYSQRLDFEGFVRDSRNNVKEFIAGIAIDQETGTLINPDLPKEQLVGHLRNIQQRIMKYAAMAREGSLDDPWQALKDDLRVSFEPVLRKTKDGIIPIKESDFNMIASFFREEASKKMLENSAWTPETGEISKLLYEEVEDVLLDRDGRRYNAWVTPDAYNQLGLKTGYVIGTVGKYDWRTGSTLHDFINRPLTDIEYGKMVKSYAEDGKLIIGGISEKPEYFWVEAAPDVELGKVWDEVPARLKPVFDRVNSISSRRLGIPKELVEKLTRQQLYLWKRVNGDVSLTTLLETEGVDFLRNVSAMVKRSQIMVQKFPPVPAYMLKGLPNEVILVHDLIDTFKKFGDTYGIDNPTAEDFRYLNDGGWLQPQVKFDEYKGAAGYDAKSGLKAFLRSPGPEGLLLGKLAMFVASPELSKFMGFRSILPKTAGKQTGTRELYHLRYSKEKGYWFSDDAGNPVNLEVTEAAPEGYVKDLGLMGYTPEDAQRIWTHRADQTKLTGEIIDTYFKRFATPEQLQRYQQYKKEGNSRLLGMLTDSVIYNSVAKGDFPEGHRPAVERAIDQGVDELTAAYEEHSRTIKAYEFKPEHLYLDTNDNDPAAKTLKGEVAKVIKQLMSIAEDTDAVDSLPAWIFEATKGTERGAKLLEAYLQSRTRMSLEALARHYDEVNLKSLLANIRVDPVLRRNFERFLLERDIIDSLDEAIEESDFSRMRMDEIAQRIINYGGGGAVNLSKLLRNTVKNAYVGYFVRRVAQPHIKYSGQSLLSPWAPDMIAKYPHVAKGRDVFMAGRDFAKVPIKYRGEEVTIGDLWTKMVSEFGDEQGNILPREKILEEKRALYDEMTDALEFVLPRVPVSDVSGMVPAKFAGFMDIPGTGIFVSDHLMRRLGGADHDIDKTFWYHGIPAPFRKYLREQADLFDKMLKLQEETPGLENLFRGKLDPDLRLAKGDPETLAATFDPFQLYQIHKATYFGRGKNLAYTISTAQNSTIFWQAVRGAIEKHDVQLPENVSIRKMPNGNLEYQEAVSTMAGKYIGTVVMEAYGDRTKAALYKFLGIQTSADAGKKPEGVAPVGVMQTLVQLGGLAKLAFRIPTGTSEKETPVHYGRGLNPILSNLADTPFIFEGRRYRTAEGAYQSLKSGQYVAGFEDLSGLAAKAQGKSISADRKTSVQLMERILQEKYKQIPQFREALNKAGRITHPVEDKFWAVEFPKLLEKIRGKVEQLREITLWSGSMNWEKMEPTRRLALRRFFGDEDVRITGGEDERKMVFARDETATAIPADIYVRLAEKMNSMRTQMRIPAIAGNRIFRQDRLTRKPWSLKDVAEYLEAEVNPEGLFKHTMIGYLSRELANTGARAFDDGFLLRSNALGGYLGNFGGFEPYNAFLKRYPWVRKMLGVDKLSVPTIFLENAIKLYRENYTKIFQNGMRGWQARYAATGESRAEIREFANKLYDSLKEEKRAEMDFDTWLAKKHWYFDNYKGRLRWLASYPSELEDYISTRYADIATLDMMIRAVQDFGLKPGAQENLDKIVGPVVEQTLWWWTQYRNYLAARKERPEALSVMAGLEDAGERFFLDVLGVAKEQAGKNNIPIEKMRRFVDALMIGTFHERIGPEGNVHYKTTEHRFGLKYARPESIADYAKAYNDAYEHTSSGTWTLRDVERVWNALAESMPHDTSVPSQETALQMDRLFLPRDTGEALEGHDQILYDRLFKAVMKWPSVKEDPERFIAQIRKIYNVVDLADLTRYDLEGMIRYFEQGRAGFTLLDRAISLFREPKPYRKVRLLDYIFFPHTVAAQKLWYEMVPLHEVVQGKVEANFYKVEPRMFQTDEGKLRLAFGIAAEPMSYMGRMLNINTNMSERTQAGQSEAHNWLNTRIKNFTNPTINQRTKQDDKFELFQFAVMTREIRGHEGRVRRGMVLEPHEEDWYRGKVRELAEWRRQYGQLLHDEYKIRGDDKLYTGSQIADMHRDVLQDILDNNPYVYATDEDWAQHFIRFSNGRIDIVKTLHRMENEFSKLMTPFKMPLEIKFATHWYTNIVHAANDMANRETGRFGLQDIYTYDTPTLKDQKQHVKNFPELLGATNTNDFYSRVSRFVRDHADEQGEAAELAHFLGGYLKTSFTPEQHFANRLLGFTEYSQFYRDQQFAKMELRNSGDYYHDAYVWMTRNTSGKRFNRITGYWPHMQWSTRKVQEWAKYELDRMRDTITDPVLLQNKTKQIEDVVHRIQGEPLLDDGGLNADMADATLYERTMGSTLFAVEKGYENPDPSFTRSRTAWANGYSMDPAILQSYFDAVISAGNKRFATTLATNALYSFRSKYSGMEERGEAPAGYTDGWEKFYRRYWRNALNYPSIFTKSELDDKVQKIRRTPYYWLSDHALALGVQSLSQKLYSKLFMTDRLTWVEKYRQEILLGRPLTDDEKKRMEELKARQLGDLTSTYQEGAEKGEFLPHVRANLRYASGMIRKLSQLEARYETAALLFHTKTMMANYFGGSLYSIVSAGFKPFWDSYRLKIWQELAAGSRKPDGTPYVFNSMKDVYEWVESTGAIQNSILVEASMVKDFREPARESFIKEVVEKVAKKHDMDDDTLFQIAERHGISRKLIQTSGYFMMKSERHLRMHSFLSGYLNARYSMFPLELPLNTPWLIDQGIKTIQTTQFLYDNANRPMFAGTNVGRIYARFKLWPWNSIRFQRDVMNHAKFMGYSPFSNEHRRLQALVTANMFALQLGQLLPYSIFDAGLPQPVGYFQDLAKFFFEDSKERDNVFFGSASLVLKHPFSIFNELMPSVTRLPRAGYELFNWMFSPDVEILSNYTMWTAFPYGRMTRDVLRVYENPAMAPDWLLGLGVHRMQWYANARRKRQQGK